MPVNFAMRVTSVMSMTCAMLVTSCSETGESHAAHLFSYQHGSWVMVSSPGGKDSALGVIGW